MAADCILPPQGVGSGGAAVAAAHAGARVVFLFEEFGEFFEHHAAQLLGVGHGSRAASSCAIARRSCGKWLRTVTQTKDAATSS